MRRQSMGRTTWPKVIAAVCGVATLALAPAAVPAATAVVSSYRVTQRVALGAPDRWDYAWFDAAGQRVFVAHGDRLSVVDARLGKQLGEVTGFPGGTHGITILGGHGYSVDGRAGTVSSFDPTTLKVTATMKAGEDADAVVADAHSGHVYVVNGDAGTLTVLDAVANTVVATVDVGTKLETPVVDDVGKLFVAAEERNEIVRVDTGSNRPEVRWPLPGCEGAVGLAIDKVGRRLFASCRNAKLIVVDSGTGRMVATLPIGRGTDGAAYDPVRHLVFSSNGIDGTISVIRQVDADRYEVAGTEATEVSGRTMTIDPASGRLFVPAADTTPPPAGATGRDARAVVVPGTLKLLFIDPAK